ncbi:MAG: HAD family hydrolase [Candidatus Helarchaeota archaeon]
MKLLLFDIDGTLTKNNSAHLQAFNSVFKDVYNLPNANINEINHHGLTDELLIYIILERHNIDKKLIKTKIQKAKGYMIEKYHKLLNKYPVSVIPGSRKFLNLLYKNNALGLVTGNLEDIARIKLNSIGIWEYFYGGGFGSDEFEREKLIKIAIARAEQNFGIRFLKKDIFLFGDTIRDIESAKKVGIIPIGISGGIYSNDDLKDAGANFVFKDFTNFNYITSCLGL